MIWNNKLSDPAPQSHDPDKIKGRGNFLTIAIPSFVSGAFIAMAEFLVILQGLYLIQSFLNERGEEHDEDAHLRILEGEDSAEVHDDYAGERVDSLGHTICTLFLTIVFISVPNTNPP